MLSNFIAKTLTLLYNAIIFPYLNYCVEVWGNTYKTNLYSLFIKQKKAIRIVCHAKYLDYTSSLFHKLRLLKSPDIVHFNTCIFMYKAFHNLLPPSIQIYFSRTFSKKYYFNYYYSSIISISMFTLQERRGRNFQTQG